MIHTNEAIGNAVKSQKVVPFDSVLYYEHGTVNGEGVVILHLKGGETLVGAQCPSEAKFARLMAEVEKATYGDVVDWVFDPTK